MCVRTENTHTHRLSIKHLLSRSISIKISAYLPTTMRSIPTHTLLEGRLNIEVAHGQWTLHKLNRDRSVLCCRKSGRFSNLIRYSPALASRLLSVVLIHAKQLKLNESVSLRVHFGPL